jgi:hypothetical protein
VEDGNAEMQLAAERIALNLREAGFRIQVASGGGGQPKADIVLRTVHLEANTPRAALNEMIGASGQHATAIGTDMTALYDAERDFLAGYTVEPLLWLPQAYAVGERIRDLRLAADGTPLIAGVALNDSK